MKGLLALVCLGVLLITVISLADQMITPEQAMQAVRDFEGNSTLQLTCSPLEQDLTGPEWARMRTYEVLSNEDEDSWLVDAASGEVMGATYADAYPDATSGEPTGPLSQGDCRQIAESFAQAKYSNFEGMGFVLREQTWVGTGWQFEWQQQVAYSAWTPNSISIAVSPSEGRIQDYSCVRIPTPVPQEPQLTTEQAIDAAKSATGIVTVRFVTGPELQANPDKTTWDLEIDGLDDQGKHLNYAVFVNAVTGQVEESYAAAVGPVTHKHSIAEVGSVGDVPARNALAKRGYAIDWDPVKKQLRAAKGLKDVIILQVGSKVATINGKPVTLDHAPKIVEGRMLVPASILKLLP